MILHYPFGNHIGEQFGHLLAVGAIESDGETGDPVVYDCKCMKCGKEHIHVLDRDLLTFKTRCCEACDKFDLTNMRFGRYTVIEFAGHSRNNQKMWKCKCDCGVTRVVNGRSLVTGVSRSCGCLHRDITANLRFMDLTGKQFGRLKVIRRVDNRPRAASGKTGCVRYECLCDCGKSVIVDGASLRAGLTKSCGCLKASYAQKLNFKDLTGKRFGRLLTVERSNRTGDYAYWKCKCDCGNEIIVSSHALLTGHTRSCGCFQRERASSANTIWSEDELPIISRLRGMISRCYNKKTSKYPEYGGRGITVCDEWRKNPRSFVDWAKNHGFRKELTIDRIDVDKGYSPDNCRWVDNLTQSRNKQMHNVIKLDVVRNLMREWARESGITYNDLFARLCKTHEFFSDKAIRDIKQRDENGVGIAL